LNILIGCLLLVNESIRFGYIDGNIHYLAIYVAQKEGYFEKTGLIPGKNIQFTDTGMERQY